MFDKLIESDTAGAEFKNRSRYFMVSTIVVGILFLTAVVYSLYASEVGLGEVNFDIAELLAPVDAIDPEPKAHPEPPNQANAHQSEIPIRTTNMARPDEYQFVPDKPSSERNNETSRPVGRFIFDPRGTNSDGIGSAPSGSPVTGQSGSGSMGPVPDSDLDEVKSTPPPLKIKPPVKTTVSEGVINGKATYLPIPPYPPPAKAVGAYGTVHVQVTISEDGRVISAKAVSGHPFLRTPAEKSAWNARFSPTYLSRVPVKVTGVIVYNFKQP